MLLEMKIHHSVCTSTAAPCCLAYRLSHSCRNDLPQAGNLNHMVTMMTHRNCIYPIKSKEKSQALPKSLQQRCRYPCGCSKVVRCLAASPHSGGAKANRAEKFCHPPSSPPTSAQLYNHAHPPALLEFFFPFFFSSLCLLA